MKKIIAILALTALCLTAAAADDFTLDWYKLDTTAENGFVHEGAGASYGYSADVTGWVPAVGDIAEFKISGLSEDQTNGVTGILFFAGDSAAKTTYQTTLPLNSTGVYTVGSGDFTKGNNYGAEGDNVDTIVFMFVDSENNPAFPVVDDDTIILDYFNFTPGETPEVPEPGTLAALLTGLLPAALKVKKAIK